ncbi:MAG: glycosyltransferase [Burkholderiales bacterium]|nr:glycosyltransferase [Burkholderiales bacterium]
MRIAIVDTYYARFLLAHYRNHPDLREAASIVQRRSLLDACFGTSDYYSRNLTPLGFDAIDLIVNCVPLQAAWARENQVPVSTLALNVPHRAFRLPILGPWLSSLPGLLEIAIAQIKALKPDVLYCQDLSFFPEGALRELRGDVRLVVGQIACPLPPESFLRGYDLILTSFPHFVDRLRQMGVASEYFRIGFDERVLDAIGSVEKDIDASFVGGISRHHGQAMSLLEHLARHTDIRFFGYGARKLPRSSAIRRRHGGEVWGLDMYRTLARSRIALNRHIDVAENYANNMRLYEATGMGAMLLTDRKDNLGELFCVDREILAYSSKEEAAELILHYKDRPEEVAAIAEAGQARTLREHTYAKRMEELASILKRHVGRR